MHMSERLPRELVPASVEDDVNSLGRQFHHCGSIHVLQRLSIPSGRDRSTAQRLPAAQAERAAQLEKSVFFLIPPGG
jgi:hypothetical protein